MVECNRYECEEMQIKTINVSNFKSFEEAGIELGKFNVLIGANASGKSNFITILQFLKDIVENGLDNAISMHGGVDYIRNITIGASKDLSVESPIDAKDKPVKSFGFGKEEDKKLIRICLAVHVITRSERWKSKKYGKKPPHIPCFQGS